MSIYLAFCHASMLSYPGLAILLLVVGRFYIQIAATLLHDFLLVNPIPPAASTIVMPC